MAVVHREAQVQNGVGGVAQASCLNSPIRMPVKASTANMGAAHGSVLANSISTCSTVKQGCLGDLTFSTRTGAGKLRAMYPFFVAHLNSCLVAMVSL